MMSSPLPQGWRDDVIPSASGLQPDGEASEGSELRAEHLRRSAAEGLDLLGVLSGPPYGPHGGPPPGPAAHVRRLHHGEGSAQRPHVLTCVVLIQFTHLDRNIYR